MNERQFDRMISRTVDSVFVKIVYWGTAMVIVVSWTIYLVYALFRVDLLAYLVHSPQRGEPTIATRDLIGAVTASIVTIIWCIATVRKTHALARYGVKTTGTVTAISPLAGNGMAPMTIVFTTDAGKQCKVRKDLDASNHAIGDTVQVRYDRTNPKRCEVR